MDSFILIRNLFILLIIDGLILDDEPLWEPLEWSVVQTWILYIYIFSWSAEVIFSSRYGSYTNRDKIVWIGLFKVYSLMKLWFLFNMIFITIFITLPFYFEIIYSVSYINLWWNWYNSIFFFKFTSIFALITLLANLVRFKVRHSNHINTYFLLIISLFLIVYLFYINFIILLFGYFTQADLFRDSGWSESSKIIHGPLKWGWGFENRDHFAYHKTPSTFWYKNDPLIASSMLFLNILIFKFLFFLIIQVLTIIRVVWASNEFSTNIITYYYSNVKEFLNFILFLNMLIVMCIVYQYIKFPFELLWFERFLHVFQSLNKIILEFFEIIFKLL